MINCNILEMKDRGFFYIWFNGYVSSRIDRVLYNVSWVIENNLIIVDFKECGIFNNILICIEIWF